VDDHHFGYITKFWQKKNTGPYRAGGVCTWKLTKTSWLNFCRNNAGASFGKFELSQDGLEKTFATNIWVRRYFRLSYMWMFSLYRNNRCSLQQSVGEVILICQSFPCLGFVQQETVVCPRVEEELVVHGTVD
jgi:hypothetical protein